MKKIRNRSIIIAPAFIGFFITTSLDIMIMKFGLHRDWELNSLWIGWFFIGASIVMMLIDADRFFVKFFKSESDYQIFLFKFLIVLLFIWFLALAIKIYIRYEIRHFM